MGVAPGAVTGATQFSWWREFSFSAVPRFVGRDARRNYFRVQGWPQLGGAFLMSELKIYRPAIVREDSLPLGNLEYTPEILI